MAVESLPYGVEPPGYRLSNEAHIGRVRLQIANLDRSVAYYETVIGLRVIERMGAVATLGAHDDARVLVELHENPAARPVDRRGHIGLYHFAILLPTRAALGRFVRHLADIGARAGSADHLVSEAIYLQDPDGLGIEVYADRPRETWQHSSRQLTMASDPLNMPDLVASGGGTPWTGAPADTVIGHVHLHVRDLAEAEKFYHDGLGFDKVVWQYPGALFLSAGGYHHHLGTNTWAAESPVASSEDAHLIEWEVVLPSVESVDGAAASLEAAGFETKRDRGDLVARDPWGTQVRVLRG
ncbi:MAG: VOC family protein [Gemmatimonadaceae bacterium]